MYVIDGDSEPTKCALCDQWFDEVDGTQCTECKDIFCLECDLEHMEEDSDHNEICSFCVDDMEKVFMRIYQERDYPIILQWMKDSNDTIVPEEYIPECGIILPNIAVGFIYQTDTVMCYLDILATNPRNSNTKSHIPTLITRLERWAIDLGFECAAMITQRFNNYNQIVPQGYSLKPQLLIHTKNLTPRGNTND